MNYPENYSFEENVVIFKAKIVTFIYHTNQLAGKHFRPRMASDKFVSVTADRGLYSGFLLEKRCGNGVYITATQTNLFPML